MKAAYIIPLTRLPSHLEGFDYSIPSDAENTIREGGIVEVLLRNRKTMGIVYYIHESDQRALKPITQVMPPKCAISYQDLQLIKWLSSWYAVSPNAAALQMAPFLYGTYGIAKDEHVHSLRSAESDYKRSNNLQPVLSYSPSRDERIEYYRRTIQEYTIAGMQTLILCPTIASVYQLARELSQSITRERLAIVHSALGKPAFRKNAQALRDGTALVGIGTRMLVFAPCSSLGYVIMHDSERIEHKQYDSNPRVDGRIVAVAKASIENAQICFSSTAPRLEEWHQRNQFFLSQEIPAQIHASVVNLTDELRNENYSFISDHLIARIEQTIREQKKTYLVVRGSGYSRLVMCASCSYLFPCVSCDRLPRYSQTTACLECSACSVSQQLPAVCPQCKGSEYKFPGIGREKIISYIKKQFPRSSVGEASKLNKQSREVFSITIGTAYSFLDTVQTHSPFGLLAFVAADPVLSMEDVRACERQWQASAACMSLAASLEADIVIQSFRPHSRFIQTLAKMDFETFARDELVARKECKQPPYVRIIRVFQSSRAQVTKEMFAEVKSRLEAIVQKSTSPRISINEIAVKRKNRDVKELVITVEMSYHPSHLLPDELLKTLRSLPNGFMHDIDPL
ncbi:hypothetical protein HYV71_03675 [Candidatus Uhrbacteria bacterium]|nr:hypothetical protein [Candidatus Uhrbacteria bacterium]